MMRIIETQTPTRHKQMQKRKVINMRIIHLGIQYT